MSEYKIPHLQQHEPLTEKLLSALEKNPEALSLLKKSLAKAAEVNPDPRTNPVRTMEQYADFLDWSTKCLPYMLLPEAADSYPKLYEQIDQSLCYFYFLHDQLLPELEGKGLYHNCIEYIEPFSTLEIEYAKAWGLFLKTPASWNAELLARAQADERFGLSCGWYESPKNWKSFNEFFSRRLSSPAARPIAFPHDENVLIAPADSTPQGVWQIDKNGNLVEEADIKSGVFTSVSMLLGPEGRDVADRYRNGVMTHTYLDEADYHRYHFPLSGKIRALYKIPALDAVGGLITGWNPESGKYQFRGDVPGWQMIETRCCVFLDTEAFGTVAILPIGMSQICSCNFEPSLRVGMTVKKGDPLGYFLFGGSDIVMLFEKKVGFRLTSEVSRHILMGTEYARLGN